MEMGRRRRPHTRASEGRAKQLAIRVPTPGVVLTQELPIGMCG